MPEIMILGTIVCNIKDIDISRCDIVKSKKRQICIRIPLDIIMSLSGEDGIMQVTVRWDDKVCGSGMLKFPDGQTITSHECWVWHDAGCGDPKFGAYII